MIGYICDYCGEATPAIWLFSPIPHLPDNWKYINSNPETHPSRQKHICPACLEEQNKP